MHGYNYDKNAKKADIILMMRIGQWLVAIENLLLLFLQLLLQKKHIMEVWKVYW